ncbi:hypothetical protein [Stenotrophomonas maltophilia]|uniref:hypothetical protein n=1 Tax=Stenotrophomonas maltophilia TaxID=40324 RepID=UPI0021CA72B3|nr:hypothetical protein [Stenotrophomonas maltophilia]MCU1136909.1 hypothetical protein [Stenotrophomonas maltophilia]
MKAKILTIAIAALVAGGSAYAGDDLLGSVSLKGVPKNTVVNVNPDAADLAHPQPAAAPQQAAPKTAAPQQASPPGLAPRQAPSTTAAAAKQPLEQSRAAPATAPAAKAPSAPVASKDDGKKSIVASVASAPVGKHGAAAPMAAATKTAAAPNVSAAVSPGTPSPASVPAVRQVPAPAVAQAPAPALIPAAQARRLKVVLSDREIAFQQQEEELVRQKRLLVLQAEIAELNKKISGVTESTEAPAPPPMPMPMNVLDIAEQAPVEVISTWGGDGIARNADVLVEGKRRTVRAGEVLPSGWRVTEVTRSSVTIQRGREKKTVPVRS